MLLTERQKRYLKLIITDFITYGEPLGSHSFIKKYKLSISSATVRHEMNVLEGAGFIHKVNTSSGRVPSTLGYKYYVENLIDDKDNKKLEQKLAMIFSKRTSGIEITISEAIKKIVEITDLTIISSIRKTDETLKSIQFVPLDYKKGTIIIVTSLGRVESKIISLNDNIKINDIKVAVRLFQERLIDTPLNDLKDKSSLLKGILMDKVVNLELVIQEFITKIFNFHFKNKSSIYGEKNIINKKDISREQIIKLISLLDKKSIWDSIENQTKDEDNLKILISDDNTSIISQKLEFDNNSREISIIGGNRLQYANAIHVLKIIERFLTKKIN